MDEFTAGLFGLIIAVVGSGLGLMLIGLVANGVDHLEGKDKENY